MAVYKQEALAPGLLEHIRHDTKPQELWQACQQVRDKFEAIQLGELLDQEDTPENQQRFYFLVRKLGENDITDLRLIIGTLLQETNTTAEAPQKAAELTWKRISLLFQTSPQKHRVFLRKRDGEVSFGLDGARGTNIPLFFAEHIFQIPKHAIPHFVEESIQNPYQANLFRISLEKLTVIIGSKAPPVLPATLIKEADDQDQEPLPAPPQRTHERPHTRKAGPERPQMKAPHKPKKLPDAGTDIQVFSRINLLREDLELVAHELESSNPAGNNYLFARSVMREVNRALLGRYKFQLKDGKYRFSHSGSFDVDVFKAYLSQKLPKFLAEAVPPCVHFEPLQPGRRKTGFHYITPQSAHAIFAAWISEIRASSQDATELEINMAEGSLTNYVRSYHEEKNKDAKRIFIPNGPFESARRTLLSPELDLSPIERSRALRRNAELDQRIITDRSVAPVARIRRPLLTALNEELHLDFSARIMQGFFKPFSSQIPSGSHILKFVTLGSSHANQPSQFAHRTVLYSKYGCYLPGTVADFRASFETYLPQHPAFNREAFFAAFGETQDPLQAPNQALSAVVSPWLIAELEELQLNDEHSFQIIGRICTAVKDRPELKAS